MKAWITLALLTAFSVQAGENELPWAKRGIDWIGDGDKFKLLAPVTLKRATTDTTIEEVCYRQGHLTARGAAIRIGGCCILYRLPTENTKLHPGLTFDVAKKGHWYDVTHFNGRVKFTKKTFFNGPQLESWERFAVKLRSIEMPQTSILTAVKCYGPSVFKKQTPDDEADLPDDKVPFPKIEDLMTQLAGILEYIPDPARLRGIVTGEIKRHEPTGPPDPTHGNWSQ